MMKQYLYSIVAAMVVSTISAFSASNMINTPVQVPMKSSSTKLSMADGDNEQNLLRWARSKRSAEFDDNVVELVRPLGLVLNEDKMGNVYVETVAPKGNAARTGKVRKCITSIRVWS